jgi:hypothetical protein
MRNINEVINSATAVEYLLWARVNCSIIDFKRVTESVINRIKYLSKFYNSDLYVHADHISETKLRSGQNNYVK